MKLEFDNLQGSVILKNLNVVKKYGTYYLTDDLVDLLYIWIKEYAPAGESPYGERVVYYVDFKDLKDLIQVLYTLLHDDLYEHLIESDEELAYHKERAIDGYGEVYTKENYDFRYELMEELEEIYNEVRFYLNFFNPWIHYEPEFKQYHLL